MFFGLYTLVYFGLKCAPGIIARAQHFVHPDMIVGAIGIQQHNRMSTTSTNSKGISSPNRPNRKSEMDPKKSNIPPKTSPIPSNKLLKKSPSDPKKLLPLLTRISVPTSSLKEMLLSTSKGNTVKLSAMVHADVDDANMTLNAFCLFPVNPLSINFFFSVVINSTRAATFDPAFVESDETCTFPGFDEENNSTSNENPPEQL